MRKTRKAVSMALAGLMALSLTACGSSSKPAETTVADQKAETTAESGTTSAATKASETSKADTASTDKTYRIGVLQLVQHAALDATNKGFIAALDDSGISYKVDQQNASGDQSTCQTIAEKLVNDKDDLIFAIATPAAMAVTGTTTEIPVLLSAVTDPAASGLVNANDNPGRNVSGTSDLTPVKEQMDLMKKLIPDAKSVGILYCNAESNSKIQADMAKKALDDMGISYKDYTVSNTNEIETVVQSMVGNVDVIYAPTDNMVAAGMATVSMVANENKIPVICGESGMVDQGGLATYGIDYYQLGYMAGEQAVKILKDGADIKTMPIGYLPAEKCELKINEDTAKILGIDTSAVK